MISAGLLKPFWSSADQRWLFWNHSETVLISSGFSEPVLKQRWWELVFFQTYSGTALISAGFYNSFWNNAEKRWFFEFILKQRWSALVFWTHSETALITIGFFNPFWDNADQRWIFKTLFGTALISAGFSQLILNHCWWALIFLNRPWNSADQSWFFKTHFETTKINVSFFKCFWKSAD